MPIRIQRKRTKGWRLPENTICVTRPGKYANPFEVGGWYMRGDIGGSSGGLRMAYTRVLPAYADSRFTLIQTTEQAVEWFRWYTTTFPPERKLVEKLRGHDLACWCALDKPCHADVWLDIAN